MASQKRVLVAESCPLSWAAELLSQQEYFVETALLFAATAAVMAGIVLGTSSTC